MATKSSPLTKAFLDDHREMTRRIAGLLDALKRGDAPAAFQFADELDRVAGPHIEFEEAVFYPLLVEARGREFVGRLYREHGEGRHAVKYRLKIRVIERPPVDIAENLHALGPEFYDRAVNLLQAGWRVVHGQRGHESQEAIRIFLHQIAHPVIGDARQFGG